MEEQKKGDKQSVPEVAAANEGTEVENVRAKGTEKGPLYHFYCPSPVPIHAEWSQCRGRYTAPLREA